MITAIKDHWENIVWDWNHSKWDVFLAISVWLLFFWLLPFVYGVHAIIGAWKSSKLMTIITGFNLVFAITLVTMFIIDYSNALNVWICN